MFDALKMVWEERSGNFYENVQRIKLFLLTIQYVNATGDMALLQSMYPRIFPSTEG